jgi:hypothetical protein
VLAVRRSTEDTANRGFVKDDIVSGQTNMEWITQWRGSDPDFAKRNSVVLLGGSSLADFRVRIAQSHARHDLTPSYWSLVGVVHGRDRLLTAPLWPLSPPERMPVTNGIRSLPLRDFDDPGLWPNIAVIRFPGAEQDAVDCIERLASQRSIIDVPTLLLSWLAFVWGAGVSGNPLLAGSGVPSAVLVEAAFGMAEVELTPGLATASSCPEAIYQAAKWWHRYYEQSAGAEEDDARHHPVGRYLLRQTEATYVEPTSDL